MKYTENFLKKIGMDTSEMTEFLEHSRKILTEYRDCFDEICELFHRTKNIDDSKLLRESLSEKSGVGFFEINGLVIIKSSEWLYEDYKKCGYSDEMFWDMMSDVKSKFIECRDVKGVFGTFVEDWYNDIFKMDIFRFGRFEFQRSFWYISDEQEVAGHIIKKNDTIYLVHIPSGGSMNEEARLDSYKRAYEFFKGELSGKPFIIACYSWLMDPDNDKIFPPHLNIVGFLHDFKIVEATKDESYSNCWRMFGCDYDGNPDRLPQDNTPRRAIASWLKSGKLCGGGKGVMIFDGDKILK